MRGKHRSGRFNRASLIASVLAALLAAVVNPLSNSAHPADAWYGHVWTNGMQSGISTDRVVQWRFVDNFPLGDGFRNRLKDGASEWNQLPPEMRFDFVSGEANALAWDTCPVPSQSVYQDDRVGWQDIPGNDALAQAYYCTINANSILLFRIRFDKDWFWYGGTEQPPDGAFDAWSVATHEFGHTGGRAKGGDGDGHFVEPSEYCPNEGSPNFSDRHTMCPSNYRGTRNQRSLEQHDRDVFNDAY